MKGDFTRSTFRPEKHYSSVRMQQGRVQLDADWNEQMDITAHRLETEAADVIGGCGGPLAAAGFALTPGPVPKIGKGRYYVGGILCENEADIDLDKQPDLPVGTLNDLIAPRPAGSAVPDGLYLAYLDVWQHHITALEDDAIREVALGGPDTATRTKTVWQVKLLGPLPAPLTCVGEPAAWQSLLDRTQDGRLSAQAAASTTPPGPCVVPEGAGYRRLENQLYRVEVHAVDANGRVTLLKWSRDNAAIVTRWLDQKAARPEELIVAGIGRDDVLRFGPGQYVEVVDDQRELRGEAGILVRLAGAEGQVLTLDMTDPNAASVAKANFPDTVGGRPNNPKVRRWDGILANPATNAWLELEDGVQIRLEAGKKYHVGDYWLIPARTVTADVEWPRDASGSPIPQPRAGVEHRYCRLAVLNYANGNFAVVQDCRKLFPPLTGLVTLLYVGGDGQEAPRGQPLPLPLRVRVVNGSAPVAGARVRFRVTQGGGSLSAAQPVVTTAPDGIAECGWTLGSSGPQQVTAELLDAGGNPVPGQVLRFGAAVSVASRGGCCVCVGRGGDYERLDEALKDLIGRGEQDICICLLHGDQEVDGFEIARKPGEPDLRIKIAGCGPGSRLILHGPVRFANVRSVILRDLAVEFAFAIEINGGALAFDHCSLVELRGCHLSGFTQAGGLLFIASADRVSLADNVFEALLPETLVPTRDLLRMAGLGALADLYSLPDHGEWRRSVFEAKAAGAAEELAALAADARRRAQQLLTEALRQQNLSPTEMIGYGKLIALLGADAVNPAAACDVLLDIRRAAAKTRPGTAIVLERPRSLQEALAFNVQIFDQDDFALVENNEIAGVLGLYGLPAPVALVDELLNVDFLRLLEVRLKENQIQFSGFLGTLQLRGNQLVRVAVSREIVAALRDAAQGKPFPFDLFGRCQWSDNVFEGGRSLVVCRHLTLQGNEFTQTAQPQGRPAPPTANIPAVAATVVADSTIYVANHGTGNVGIQNLSRLVEQVANQEITIV